MGPEAAPAAARLSLAASICGLGLSLWLARIKFGVDYWCEATGCLTGGSCDEALTSPWSQFVGVPWPLWALGAAVASATLALPLARGRPAPGAAAGLLALATIACMTAGVLAIYAFTTFRQLCPYCLALDLVCLIWLGSAWVLARRARPLALRDAYPGLVLSLVVTTALTVGYRFAARHGTCAAPSGELPPGALVDQGPHVRWLILVFLDPACPDCAGQFERLRSSAPTLREREAALHFYLFPRMSCDDQRLPAHAFIDGEDRPIAEASARANFSCLAAQAALCGEHLAPGRGLDVLAALFKLQDAAPFFTRERVLGALAPLDPRLASPALERCFEDDAIRGVLTDQQRYLLDWVRHQGTSAAVPRMFIAPVRESQVVPSEATYASDADKVLQFFRP